MKINGTTWMAVPDLYFEVIDNVYVSSVVGFLVTDRQRKPIVGEFGFAASAHERSNLISTAPEAYRFLNKITEFKNQTSFMYQISNEKPIEIFNKCEQSLGFVHQVISHFSELNHELTKTWYAEPLVTNPQKTALVCENGFILVGDTGFGSHQEGLAWIASLTPEMIDAISSLYNLYESQSYDYKKYAPKEFTNLMYMAGEILAKAGLIEVEKVHVHGNTKIIDLNYSKIIDKTDHARTDSYYEIASMSL